MGFYIGSDFNLMTHLEIAIENIRKFALNNSKTSKIDKVLSTYYRECWHQNVWNARQHMTDTNLNSHGIKRLKSLQLAPAFDYLKNL